MSDFVLACSVFYAVSSLFLANKSYIAIGLLIQGAAACMGIVRFAMKRPESTPVFKAHKILSWFASTAGLGLIAYQYCFDLEARINGYIIIAFAGVVTLTSQFMDANNKQLFVQACSGLSLLTVFILSALSWNVFGMAAALTYIFIGALFGKDGTSFGILNVDLLHYGLVMGNIFYKWSFTDQKVFV